MAFRYIAAFVAAALVVIFIGPVVVKLKDVALSVVVLIGITMMVVDAWQALKATDD